MGMVPSKNEVIELGAQFALPVVIVTSVDHYTAKEYPDFVHFVYVDKGPIEPTMRLLKKFNRAIFSHTRLWLSFTCITKKPVFFIITGQNICRRLSTFIRATVFRNTNA